MSQRQETAIDFRAATQGTREGEKISIRILDQANSVSKVEQLNMRKQMQEHKRLQDAMKAAAKPAIVKESANA